MYNSKKQTMFDYFQLTRAMVKSFTNILILN